MKYFQQQLTIIRLDSWVCKLNESMLSMNSRQRRAKGETDLEDQYRNAILPTINVIL